MSSQQKRLRETTFESHDFTANNKVLQHAAQEMTVLQNDMLVQRIRQREHLQSMSLKEAEMGHYQENEKPSKFVLESPAREQIKNDSKWTSSDSGSRGRPFKRITGIE